MVEARTIIPFLEILFTESDCDTEKFACGRVSQNSPKPIIKAVESLRRSSRGSQRQGISERETQEPPDPGVEALGHASSTLPSSSEESSPAV